MRSPADNVIHPPPTPPHPTRPRARADLTGLPAERLEAEVLDLTARMAAGTYELLVLVGELDRRGSWATSGALSCAAWLADRCDIELSTARTQVRIARAMVQFPAIAAVDATVARTNAPAGASLAQQRTDAFVAIVTGGNGNVKAEVVIHVTAAGNRLPDGTPLSDDAAVELLPDAYVSLLFHDTDRQPIDASPRRRHPERRLRARHLRQRRREPAR